MGTAASVPTSNTAEDTNNQSLEQFESVEEFTEQAYFDGSKIDGFSQILSNPRGKAAFIKFLNTENGTENFKFFEEMDRLNTIEKQQLGVEGEKLFEDFKMPVDADGNSKETKEDAVESFSNLTKKNMEHSPQLNY